MISLVAMTDVTGRKHEVWLDGMQFRVDSSGEFDMRATITGRIVAEPGFTASGPRIIVNTDGELLGTYAQDEKWVPKP